MNEFPNGIDPLTIIDPRLDAIERKKREIAEAEAAREAVGANDTVDVIMQAAIRATGMTREQILAGAPQPLALPAPTADRDTVVARGVPELHIRHVYDNAPAPCDALDAVRDFISGPQTLLVLSGGVGTRKSGSACWALSQRAGRYVTADDLSRLAAAKDEEGVVAYRKAKKAQLLVVDDLGGEYLDEKGWFARVFNSLIDHRYSACLKTIITTNLDPAKFKANYGERVADRIRESGRFLEVGGQSVRRK